MRGHGDEIVLIHDGLIHHEVWDGQFEFFAETNRVIRYDRRGYGKSPQPEQPYSDVEDLNRLFEVLEIKSARLFGMSAGGKLAVDFTLKYPEKVNSLVLVGAVVSGLSFTDHFYTRGGHRPANLIAGANEAYLTYWTDFDPYEMWSDNIEGKKRARKILLAYPHNGDIAKIRYIKAPERPAINHLSEIKVPTIILVGEFDIADVHAHAGALEAGISESRRIIVEKTGHLIPIERPDLFNETVINALGELNFQSIVDSKGVATAIDTYRKDRRAGVGSYKVSENDINNKGYNYLFNGKVEEALLLFKLNVEEYPNSANVYDSYGEALMTLGDTVQAIINYEKSLKLNPENNNAVEMLKKLRNK
jgi:pimeloyl-ACP methyl ester carboxylesterase